MIIRTIDVCLTSDLLKEGLCTVGHSSCQILSTLSVENPYLPPLVLFTVEYSLFQCWVNVGGWRKHSVVVRSLPSRQCGSRLNPRVDVIFGLSLLMVLVLLSRALLGFPFYSLLILNKLLLFKATIRSERTSGLYIVTLIDLFC